VYSKTFNGDKFVIDETLEILEKQISPSDFFRANRQFIVSKQSILKAQNYYNRRFVLKTNPPSHENILISKARISLFKALLGI